MNPASPLAYARQLTKYIADPSTVRVRVLEYFGEAPPIEKIRYFRNESERLSKVRQIEPLAPPEVKVAPKRVVHTFTPPEPRDEPAPITVPVVGVAKALIASVARTFTITPEDIRGKARDRVYCDARSIVVLVLKARGWSYPVIGRELGGRDHSTTSNLVRRFAARAKAVPDLQAVLDAHMQAFRLAA